MSLFENNKNEKEIKNEKLPDLKTEKAISDESLEKVAGGYTKVGIARPFNDGSGLKR